MSFSEMKKVIFLSIVIFTVFCFKSPADADYRPENENSGASLFKTESGEVKLKSASDLKNTFKSNFITRVLEIVKKGRVNEKRHARIKKEIEKMRGRSLDRLNRINADQEILANEKQILQRLLTDLDSVEAQFAKIKISNDYDDETAEIRAVKKSKKKGASDEKAKPEAKNENDAKSKK